MGKTDDNLLNRAILLHQEDRLEEAEQICAKLRSSSPRDPDVLHVSGLLALGRGNHAEAKRLIQRAVKINPNDPNYHSNLGVVLKNLGEFEASIKCLDRALEIQPIFPDAWNNRGLALDQIMRYEEALESFDKATSQRSTFATAWTNRGCTLQRLDRYEEALLSHRRAFALDPKGVDAAHNYGVTLALLRRYEEAKKAFDHVLRINPRHLSARQARGEVLTDQGEQIAARQDFAEVLRLDPENKSAHWALAALNMTTGALSEGWRMFDRRFDTQILMRFKEKPRWKEPTGGERVLIWTEQGIGDEIFFLSWLKGIEPFAKNLRIAISRRLLPLMSRTFPQFDFVDIEPLPAEDSFDAHCPIGSIAPFLISIGENWELGRHSTPYLVADSDRTTQLRQRLTGSGKLICGLTWRSTRPKHGTEKSLSLDQLETILSIPNVQFVNLQYGDTADEIAAFRSRTGVDIITVPEIDNFNDLEGHAALVNACDFVALVCNATAHFAGSLGKPGFVLAPHGRARIWYWGNRTLDGHSLWYPTLEVFDETLDLSWAHALEQAERALRRRIS